jgi:hypothetical protein
MNEVSGARCSFRAIDVALEPLDLARQHPQAFGLALALGHREIGAEIEQVVLDQAQHRIEFARVAKVQPHHADGGVGFVHGAIGGDAQIVFRAALAAAERSGAVVAGLGIDAVEHDHRRFPFSCLYLPIAQTATMVMTMATNCSNTRSRIRLCERFGEPPRIMLMRPSSRTSATAATAMGRTNRTQKGCHRCYITPRKGNFYTFTTGSTIWLLTQ